MLSLAVEKAGPMGEWLRSKLFQGLNFLRDAYEFAGPGFLVSLVFAILTLTILFRS
ncbi:MAG: hypothetical protein KIS81_12510 [Maricaulaceae bacterium]|nr:hypothetical protein [Maricaulaceae bacterium]